VKNWTFLDKFEVKIGIISVSAYNRFSDYSTVLNMTTAIDIGTLITRTPGTCSDRPHIAGRRLSVQQVAALTQQGLNPQEITQEYEGLTLAQVHAALAYYHANLDEIEADLADEKAEYDRLASGALAQ
jgi:uncharacterized protein (DUF433 family)